VTASTTALIYYMYMGYVSSTHLTANLPGLPLEVANGANWLFFSIWLQVFPFGYTIFLIIPQINEVGSIVFNLAAKMVILIQNQKPKGSIVFRAPIVQMKFYHAY